MEIKTNYKIGAVGEKKIHYYLEVIVICICAMAYLLLIMWATGGLEAKGFFIWTGFMIMFIYGIKIVHLKIRLYINEKY